MNTTFNHTDISDLKKIQQIAKKTIDQSYRYFLGDDTVEQYLTSNHLDTYLKEHINHAWSLHHDHDTLGFSIVIDNVIDFMVIDVDHHRKGYGTKLLQYCEDLLFENYRVIALESFEQNAHAYKFYEANHWEKIAQYRDHKYNAVKHIFRKHYPSDT